MKKDSKDMWLMITIIATILGIWVFLYSQGILDEELPEPIKKEFIDTKIEKIQEKISLKKEEEKKENLKIKKNNSVIVMETSLGDFEIEMYDKLMPITTTNFEKLVKEKFYNGVRFHRVIKDFMIQAGDPNSKDLSKKNIWGQGGPGYSIKDEHILNKKLTNKKYTISMANSGPQTGGSQFFINTKNNEFLDFNKQPLTSKHPVFGKIIKGFNIIDKIENSKNGEVIIKKVYIK